MTTLAGQHLRLTASSNSPCALWLVVRTASPPTLVMCSVVTSLRSGVHGMAGFHAHAVLSTMRCDRRGHRNVVPHRRLLASRGSPSEGDAAEFVAFGFASDTRADHRRLRSGATFDDDLR